MLLHRERPARFAGPGFCEEMATGLGMVNEKQLKMS